MSRPASPTTTLTRVFVRRFFENDFTGGSGDLRSSFFWLLAFVAPIGILMPWSRTLQYTCYFLVSGPESLGFLSVEDKAFYLGLGMVATGVIGVITWPSFLLDRRDVLVLGAMPLRPSVIVRAKVLGVLAYAAALAIGMHAGASLVFGLLLTDGRPFTFVLRSIAAHGVVSCAASLFVVLTIVAAQALVMALAPRRLCARISQVVQACTAASVIGLLIALPSLSSALVFRDARWQWPSTRRAVLACAPGMRPQLAAGSVTPASWTDLTPVAWFTGLYEWALGSEDARIAALAVAAGIALLVVIGIVVVAYPLAARRMLRDEVEGLATTGSTNVMRGVVAWAIRHLTRHPTQRAVMQFFLATIFRMSTHRFVLALGLGATVALLLPAIVGGLRVGELQRAVPPVALLSVPLIVMMGNLVTVRVAASLPSELPGLWIFRLTELPAVACRSAVRRLVWIGAIVCPLAIVLPVYWHYWGVALALTHGVICAALGAALTELALRDMGTAPCTQPWQPSRLNLKTWWPVYLGAFISITQLTPRLSLALAHSPSGASIVAAALLGAAWFIHRTHTTSEGAGAGDDDLLAPQVLHLQ